MRKFLVPALSAIIFFSCRRDKCPTDYAQLSADDRSYVQSWYSEGEQHAYQDQSGNKDTLVTGLYLENAPHRDGTSGCIIEGSTYGSVDLKLHGGTLFNFYQAIGQAYINQPDFPISGSTQSMQIGAFNYNGVYTLTVDSNNVSSGRVWKIYYSKNDGIVGYSRKGGSNYSKIW